MRISIKRVYDKPTKTDGVRVLVDRLWPRGLSKVDASVDIWVKELAPSNELRKWFGHEEAKFREFARRYRAELAQNRAEVKKLVETTCDRTITLLYGAKNTKCNNAVVLQDWLKRLVERESK